MVMFHSYVSLPEGRWTCQKKLDTLFQKGFNQQKGHNTCHFPGDLHELMGQYELRNIFGDIFGN
jgi:hypothetical protein